MCNQCEELKDELERWKSIAQEINTDWIPANIACHNKLRLVKKLHEELATAAEELFDSLIYQDQRVANLRFALQELEEVL